MRRRGRLARTMLRGLLLVGGALGAWGAYDAVADEPAYAAGSSGPCLPGELIDGVRTILGSPLSCAPTAGPNGGEAAEPAAREPAAEPGAGKGTRHSGTDQAPAWIGRGAPPTEQRAGGMPSADAPAPAGRGAATPARDASRADSSTAPGQSPDPVRPGKGTPTTVGPGGPASALRPPARPDAAPPAPGPPEPAPDPLAPALRPTKPILETLDPALRPAKPNLETLDPVLGPTTPIGQALGLAEPVVETLEPVLGLVEPVVDALAPVLDVAQPSPGGPTGPRTPPASVGGVRSPATTPPPVTAAPPGTAHATPAAPVDPRGRWSGSTFRPSGGDRSAAGDAEAIRHRPPAGDPGHAHHGTPAGCGSTAGHSAAGCWSGITEGALSWAWHPELWPLGGQPARSDKLTHRASRPDTRPA
ncbi:hypothetical protein [Micromonospora sp. S4605]|uniref:hypothetical protein n=1 Tax=Micromonospora sp. S4605 TaxID=1420897 RepID=UPI0011B772B7|nr:hypothetical protein [Micromonospora sp. S4605]